ncbi:MAG: hypothetical protein GY853_07210 [PVC group bacterium]|nr:hypothetical protein [PVC group bacterium]
MNNITQRVCGFFLFILGCALIIPGIDCYGIMPARSLEDITLAADNIVVGQVLATNTLWNQDKTLIVTEVKVSISDVIKGDFTQEVLTVEFIGGEIGTIGLKVSDTPEFQANEEIVLFSNNIKDRPLVQKITGRTQGKCKVQENLVSNIKEVTIAGGKKVDDNGQVFTEASKTIPLDVFISEIKEVLVK